MSNETDLDWLARNVYEWPVHVDAIHVGVGIIFGMMGWCVANIGFRKSSKITRDQWLARRSELQNKPSWEDAPEWASSLTQSSAGTWVFFEIEASTNTCGGWGNNRGRHFVAASGEALGDWRDTLEKRPEEFKKFNSIEDNQEFRMSQQQVKQDNGWFERGDPPPVGAACEFIRSGFKDWKRCEILFMGKVSLVMNTEKVSEQRFALHDIKFRPIRTERDVLVDVIVSQGFLSRDGTVSGEIADDILAAGFSLRGK